MDLTQDDAASDIDGGDNAAALVAAWVLFGCALVVAVVTFVLSFHGLNDYGHKVAGLANLSPLVPLGVDGLTVTAIAATFLLAHASFRQRAYAWTVFFVANGASVAGNLSHADARHLSWQGSIGAAAWPLLLTLASHLAIVTRRHLMGQTPATTRVTVERQPDATPATVAPVVDAPVDASAKVLPDADEPAAAATPDPVPDVPADVPEPPAVTPPKAEPDATDVVPETPKPATPKRRAPTLRPAVPRQPRVKRATPETRAQQMWRDGKSHAEIALALAISKKTAERYTQPLRQNDAVDEDHPADLDVAGMTGGTR
jgi:hypothetical protein